MNMHTKCYDLLFFFIINNKTSSKNNQKSTMNPSTLEVYEGYSKRSIKKMHRKYNYQVTQTKKQKHRTSTQRIYPFKQSNEE